MGYDGKRQPEEGHPCIGHRVDRARVAAANNFAFLFAWLFRQLLPFLRAGKLRLRQTDVSDLERNARLPTQKWVRGVERRGDLTTVTLCMTPDRLTP